MQRPWPSSSEVEMPLEELALCVLARLAADKAAPGQRPLRTGRINSWVVAWDEADGHTRQSATEALVARADLGDALAEAWDWLVVEGCLAQAASPSGNLESYFVTRRGRDLLAGVRPIAVGRGGRRLGLDLHPELAGRLQPLIRAGAFEQAALQAFRQVEVRVRELAAHPVTQRGRPLIGLALIQHAFGDHGALTDKNADAGEQRGLRELFSGAFGAVRNPLGRGSVEWDDPTEAADWCSSRTC